MNNSSSTSASGDSNKATTYLAIAVFLVSLGLAGHVARWAWQNIQAAHPIEYRENAVLFTSDFVVRGHNPYLLKDRPVYVNGFGMGYYWATYPFTRLGGNSYQMLRMASLLFVGAACALLAWALRVDKTPWLFTIAAALVLFSQLGQGLSIVARPDGFGLLLLMASLVIPYRLNFSSPSLAIAAALSILGYLTKAYFLIGIPVLFVYVFLFENKVRALVFGASSAIAFVLVMFLMDRAYECYLNDSFFASLQGASRSWEHLAEHGSTFVLMNLWFFIILLARFLVRDSNTKTERRCLKFEWRKMHSPFLSTKASFPGVILLLHALALIFVLGLHLGNDVLYYHQLASPFLLWIAFWLAAVRFRGRWAFTLALLINIAAFAGTAKPLRKEDPSAWKMVEQEIAMRTNVFTSPHLSHLLYRRGAPVYDTGHTEAIRGAFDRNFTRVNEAYRTKADAFFEDIRMQVRNKNFDAVIVLRDWGPMLSFEELQQHYVRGKPLSAPMTFGHWLDNYPLEVWVPRDR